MEKHKEKGNKEHVKKEKEKKIQRRIKIYAGSVRMQSITGLSAF